MNKCFIIIILLFVNSISGYEIEDLQNDRVEFEYCDHGTPDTIGDCTRFQTEESSCCYFKYGAKVGCVMLGKRYLGETEYGGLTIICKQTYLQKNLLMILLITVMYIVLF